MTEYRFDRHPATPELTDQGRALLNAVRLGFHEPTVADEHLARWWDTARADGHRLRAAYGPVREHGLPADYPVATFTSFDQTINTGHGRLAPANFITDVTVRPTHRRRGLMRQLMIADLTEAAERGLAFATLTASEGTIYGRFGFGVATRRELIEVTTDARFRLRERASDRVELADPRGLTAVYQQVCDAFHTQHTGSHARPAFYWPMLTGEWDWEKTGPNPDLRAALHYDPDGAVDGFAVFAFAKDKPELTVSDLVAANPAAELGLWQLLGEIDLVEKVHFTKSYAGALLPQALIDPRLVKVIGAEDVIWLRILDAAQALAVRGFDADGTLTLGVSDPLGFASGTYRLEVITGRAEVTRIEAEPEVRVDIEGLASIYFGLVSPLDLAAVGRVSGDWDAVLRFARLFRTDRQPHNLTHF